MTQAVVIRDPTIASAVGQFAVIQSAAQTFGLEVSPVDGRDPGEIEHAIMSFLRPPNRRIGCDRKRIGLAQRDALVTMATRRVLRYTHSITLFAAAA